MTRWIAALAMGLAAPAAAQKPPASPTALFASDVPIKVTIRGPFATLVLNRAEIARPGTMSVDGATYPITLAPRGITRLGKGTCDFPPLRIRLTQAAPVGSLFERQRSLKLVTHCKRSPEFQQKVLLEYSAYRLYNLMTPQSFRARLANIDYLDEAGHPFASRVGFFVEDFSDVAKRNGMRDAKMGSLVPVGQIDPTSGARFAIFENMISNYDWSMRAAPKGEECCHNARMMTADGPGSPLTVVPYDFDFSGLVDAPYAGVPEGIPVSDLKERTYRGYCMHMTQARLLASQLSTRRAEFTGVFATIPGLDQRNQSRAASFIQGFFSDLDHGRVFKSCVN
ncbi:MAG: hypothetical protein ACJ8EP_11355 [Sphingomicrobium sp.]